MPGPSAQLSPRPYPDGQSCWSRTPHIKKACLSTENALVQLRLSALNLNVNDIFQLQKIFLSNGVEQYSGDITRTVAFASQRE